MSNFRTFETAYKKALSNNRRPRDAVQYALNKFIADTIEELDFHAGTEMREYFADEAFEVYYDAHNDHDTHGDAAHAAIKYIERELKGTDSGRDSHTSGSSVWSHDESRSRGSGSRSNSSRGESRSSKGNSRWSSSRGEPRGNGRNSSSQGKGSFGTRGQAFYNYHDPRNNDTATSAHSKPAYNYDDPRNVRPSSSTRSKTAYSSEDSYGSYPEDRGASGQGSCGCRKDRGFRSRGEPLYDYEDMLDALPKDGRSSDRCRKDGAGNSRRDSYTSYYDVSDSSMPPPRGARSDRDSFLNHSYPRHGRSGGQRPPIPAGFGRFKFPSPIFTKGSSARDSFFATHESRPTDHDRHNRREFRPSHHGEHDTRESRPSENRHNTREFKPSWYGGDNSGSPCPSEYGYAYTSDSHAPPRNFHKSSRSPPPSSSKKPSTCYYTVLGISRTSTPDEIKAAYRKMSMKQHPDRVAGTDKEKATEKMAEINQANDVLSDVVKRQFYDRTGCVPELD